MLTLVLVIVAHMMRMTRAAILNVMASPYIEMALLKGLPKSRIVVRHALPNALAPIINVVVLNLAYLIVGVVVVEVVFVYPGIGQFMVDDVSKRDVPVVQACGLIFAATYHPAQHDRRHPRRISANPRLRQPQLIGRARSCASAAIKRESLPALIGIVVVVINLLVAVFAPLIAPYRPGDVVGDAWADAERRSIGWAPTISAAICCRA